MSGEGCCFLALHPDAPIEEPMLNGWMAEFSLIHKETTTQTSPPSITKGHYRFMGATFDPIGLCRLTAVWELFDKEKITTFLVKNHVRNLQNYFLQAIDQEYRLACMVYHEHQQGNFLALKFTSAANAENFVKQLKERLVFTDSRDKYVRFGFSLYHDQECILELACVLNALKATVQSKLEPLV